MFNSNVYTTNQENLKFKYNNNNIRTNRSYFCLHYIFIKKNDRMIALKQIFIVRIIFFKKRLDSLIKI